MNAKVGYLVNGLKRVMGRHAMGTVNDNGERLKEFCDFIEMVITGTIFHHQEIHKQTSVLPDGKITTIRYIILWLTECFEPQW